MSSTAAEIRWVPLDVSERARLRISFTNRDPEQSGAVLDATKVPRLPGMRPLPLRSWPNYPEESGPCEEMRQLEGARPWFRGDVVCRDSLKCPERIRTCHNGPPLAARFRSRSRCCARTSDVQATRPAPWCRLSLR